MLTIRKAKERGHADHGWLDTWHTFSFADYHDPEHMGFRVLRVINEDRVQPGLGFGTHGHHDMEILTYVLEGALEHKDSMGTGSLIRPGELQYMSAGSGVMHSEFNASKSELVHLLQIWILPAVRNAAPSYDQKNFKAALKPGALVLLASNDGREGSIELRQDVRLFAGILDAQDDIEHVLAPSRYGWLQVARGSMRLNDLPLEAGDGVAIREETRLQMQSQKYAEFLLFDLP